MSEDTVIPPALASMELDLYHPPLAELDRMMTGRESPISAPAARSELK